jgi:hypothetical protein
MAASPNGSPKILTFEDAYDFVGAVRNRKGDRIVPHLLLGNGFSINYDPARFSYGALRAQAEARGLIGPLALRLFHSLHTQDFELVIRGLADAATSLELLDPVKYAPDIAVLSAEVDDLKEALAQVLAGLHPERPYEIADDSYQRVRDFTDRFASIYTASYDLLLYWSLMQDIPGSRLSPRASDDGFRDPGYDAEYVLWDYLQPLAQKVHYLHGALHLFRGADGLRKLTWRRTQEPLIDQIREQLSADFYPLYIAEGTSDEKLERIHRSDYLSRAHRSLAACKGGLLVYGLSFGKNDAHIVKAIERSGIERIAVSIHGDPRSAANQAIIKAVQDLRTRRLARSRSRPLEVVFFGAGSVRLW